MATVKLLPRIKRELQILESDLPQGIICYPVDDSCMRFAAQIKGSKGTPYEDGTFKIDIQITARYPIEPPKVQFVTPIYHPNIDSSGRICLDALKMPPTGSWRPSLNISTVLISLSVLMGDPNPDDPLDVDIAKEYKENRPLFLYKARESTLKHAVDAAETSTLSLEHHPTESTATTTTTTSSSSSSSSTVSPPVVPPSSSSDSHKHATIEIATATSSCISERSATSATSLAIPAASRLLISKKKSLSRSHPARLTAPLVVKTPSNDVTPRSANEAEQVQTDDVVYTSSGTTKSADVVTMVKAGDMKNEGGQQVAEPETGAEPEPGAEPGAEPETEPETEMEEGTKTEAEAKTEVEPGTKPETEMEAETNTEAEAAKRDNESPEVYEVVMNLDDDKENVKIHGAEESLNKGKENVGLRPVETNTDKDRENVKLDIVKANLGRDKENIGLGMVKTNLHKDKENVELCAVETNFDKDKDVNLHTLEARVVVSTDKTAAPPEQDAMAVTALQKTTSLATVSDRKRKILVRKRKEAGTVTGEDEEEEGPMVVKKLRQDE